MAVPRTLNKNNSAVKRVMQEARELANDPCTDYTAAPLEDDIFEWHCTLRGPAGTDFEGGLYHFRILLPAEYPFRPPSILMLTPNGRFELNTKICISFTNYHEESWQPAWGVRTAIIGLQGFFPLTGRAALGVGSLETSASERRRLATLSRTWVCPHCGRSNLECLPDPHDAGMTGAGEGPEEADAQRGASQTAHTPRSPAEAPTSPPAPVSAPAAAAPAPAVATAAATQSGVIATPAASRAASARATTRPPLLLDAAICVLLVLVFALIVKRIF